MLMILRKEDFGRAKVLVNDAARSGSYLYPIKVGAWFQAVYQL